MKAWKKVRDTVMFTELVLSALYRLSVCSFRNYRARKFLSIKGGTVIVAPACGS